jgi:hypothetical protein
MTLQVTLQDRGAFLGDHLLHLRDLALRVQREMRFRTSTRGRQRNYEQEKHLAVRPRNGKRDGARLRARGRPFLNRGPRSEWGPTSCIRS